MSTGYQAVMWNRQKKKYDLIMLGLVLLYILLFCLVTVTTNPGISVETLIIRSTASCAFLMLHVILLIGPLCRLDKRFYPLLYNRRHLGVTMFLITLVHVGLSIGQFHALGDINPIASIFLSNTHFDSLSRFPFQPLGFFAFLILFLMAATSHDFWLKNLSPRTWKTLHMGVYLAYALIVAHVVLGYLQYESSPVNIGLLAVGMMSVVGAHLWAASKSRASEIRKEKSKDQYVHVCTVSEIEEDRAKLAVVDGEEIAIYRYAGKLTAVHNLCKHQNGPLSEGKIIDGCITCPWHGYQYLPENGCSPPPFDEKVRMYKLRVEGDQIFVDPTRLPEGEPAAPVIYEE